jgi:hypothetical protein
MGPIGLNRAYRAIYRIVWDEADTSALAGLEDPDKGRFLRVEFPDSFADS